MNRNWGWPLCAFVRLSSKDFFIPQEKSILKCTKEYLKKFSSCWFYLKKNDFLIEKNINTWRVSQLIVHEHWKIPCSSITGSINGCHARKWSLNKASSTCTDEDTRIYVIKHVLWDYICWPNISDKQMVLLLVLVQVELQIKNQLKIFN